MIESPVLLDRVIRSALEEDLGTGDLTTDLIVDPGLKGTATLLAREELVLAGMHVFGRVFQILSDQVSFEHTYRDGEVVPAGRKICRICGAVSIILKGERTALNFLQRMSGIATMTRGFVEKCGGREVRVVDTRKTAPGLRMLDKYAVRTGGGFNHRFGLYDGILIKDNHIAAAGSITRAVNLAKQGCPHTLKVEVEVEDFEGLREAIEAGADVVLLDNMPPELMRKAVELARGRVLLEASGGIGAENIESVAETGVHLISVGALTHSARGVDMSLELERS
ncbi:MAG: carboxylating nicotinate-nucleotide diphosphorylase [Deltaproteobacteria bacterium]|nr:carboxylating nicotinate-nucleotide diphosphorylase [Deltaproteobacteria bacterium]